ncbi:hypothetical protein LIER_35756 [Lithospermum erythrorhizon]|uniref:Retrotransposon Copia-like N-terminal domain-containing protein n=1 Tax=Lithospermum erythrorhizon TaxID=34254 RepID=A0AAV3NX78_LITER
MTNNNENVPQNANVQIIRVASLYLHSSDHSSLVLVTDLQTEHNYTPWSRSIMIALEARNKLSFVKGENPEPEVDHYTYRQWRKREIKESFGKSNGPKIYELRRKIYAAKQGNDSVTVYYNKLKRLWDEFRCIKPNLVRMGDDEEKVMQFLMGLNDKYEAIRDQILLMEPLPSISKTYSMITNVESQRTVHSSINKCVENTVLQTGVYSGGKVQSHGQRFDKSDKSHLKYDHCRKREHFKAGWFKLRGYPDWWPGAKDMNLKSKRKFVIIQVSMEEDQDAHMINSVMITKDFGEDNPVALNQGMDANEHMKVLLSNLEHLGEVLQESVQVGKSSNACNILTHFSSSVLFKGCDS